MDSKTDAQRPPSQSYGAASSPQRIRPVADMEKIASLCKRRGFIFQSSEIYGGLNGSWDYGPLGVELKRNLKNYWWHVMVHERDDVVGMDGSILMNRAVWKASGHEDTFSDPMVDCLVTGKRFRGDQIVPQSGRVVDFVGAVDGASFHQLLDEKEHPERSTIWSQIDLAPYLREVCSNVRSGCGREGIGYMYSTGNVASRPQALRALR